MKHLYAVILAGGSGTRLWPVSTKENPKQFHALISDRTLLQETIDRVKFLPPERIIIATNKKYEAIVKEQAPEIPHKNIIVEPAMRDTAPCIGYAAALLQKRDPKAIMSVVYADHRIFNIKEFQKKLTVAAKVAEQKKTLNIIEVKAEYPNTNLGYVQIGEHETTIDDVLIYKFIAFKEKPNLKTAREFVNSFNYLWNTGYYVWSVNTILKAFEKHAPAMHKKFKIIQKDINTEKAAETLKNEYKACEKISIDYAIMEKVKPEQVRIIPATLGWSDIGTWESLFDYLKTKKGNLITKGNVVEIGSDNALIYNYEGKKIVAAIDVDNIAIVNTEDAVLICPLGSSHKVKELAQKITKHKHERGTD